MSRTLKRRAEAISRDNHDDSDSGSASEASDRRQAPRPTQTQQQSRQQRRRSTPPSNVSHSESDPDPPSADEDGSAVDLQALSKTLVKKLVRLALSCEYARQPLRRTDINTKILKAEGTGVSGAKGVTFRTVFNGAQQTLRTVFGMELVDLPSREKVGLNDRRKAASQKATQREATQKSRAQRELDGEDGETQGRGRAKDPLLSAQTWILVSTLPMAYRSRPELFVPSRAPDAETEATYTALCAIVVSLLYLHTPSGSANTDNKKETAQTQAQSQPEPPDNDITEPISDAKLIRYLSRLGLQDWTPTGATLDKLLARMLRDGYVDKRRDNSTGEEIVEWVVGPRGKREIGRKGVAGLVRGVYEFGVDGTGKGLERPRAAPGDSDDEQEQEQNEPQEDGRQQPRRAVKMERDELERRLARTLGDVVAMKLSTEDELNGDAEHMQLEPDGQQQQNGARGEGGGGGGSSSNARRKDRSANQPERRAMRRSTRRRGNHDDDDGDDNE